MDVENFITTSRSVNNINLTPLQIDYINSGGKFEDRECVKKFLGKRIICDLGDPEKFANKMYNEWKLIEEDFLVRADKMFRCDSDFWPLVSFITINSRCGYSIDDAYFFANGASYRPMSYVMHELFHFYSWFYIRPTMNSTAIAGRRYNDFKESITEILNIEFADLMDSASDFGYKQHAEIRIMIRNAWLRSRDIRHVVKTYEKWCEKN